MQNVAGINVSSPRRLTVYSLWLSTFQLDHVFVYSVVELVFCLHLNRTLVNFKSFNTAYEILSIFDGKIP